MAIEAKRSFLRFGGRLDTIYNWLVSIFFVLSCFVHLGSGIRHGSVPDALGAAIGQTVFVAIALFVIFKLISIVRR